jgi:hypothetical protein
MVEDGNRYETVFKFLKSLSASLIEDKWDMSLGEVCERFCDHIKVSYKLTIKVAKTEKGLDPFNCSRFLPLVYKVRLYKVYFNALDINNKA